LNDDRLFASPFTILTPLNIAIKPIILDIKEQIEHITTIQIIIRPGCVGHNRDSKPMQIKNETQVDIHPDAVPIAPTLAIVLF